MFDAIKPFLASLIRHGLTVAGGALASHGVTVADGDMNTLVGAAMIVVGVIWSFVQKKLSKA